MSVLLRLARAIIRHKKLAFYALFWLIALSVCLLCIAQILQHFVDSGISLENLSDLYQSSWQMIVLIICFCVATFARYVNSSSLANKIIYDLRLQVYQTLLKLSIKEHAAGYGICLENAITQGCASVEVIIREAFSFMLRNIIIFVSSAALMYSKIPLLALYVYFGVSIVGVAVLGIMRKKPANQRFTTTAAIYELLAESIKNIKLLYSYNLQQNFLLRCKNYAQVLLDEASLLAAKKAAAISAVMAAITVAIILIITFASKQVVEHTITSGVLVSFIVYCAMFVSSLIGILNNCAQVQPQLEKLSALFALIDNKNYEIDAPGLDQVPSDFNISFEGVDFAYDQKLVISKFSQQIKHGEIVSLCGPSGCGKTTLNYLLLKFYPLVNGKIKLGGRCIDELSNYFVREKIKLVTQEPLLFNLSILENITLGAKYLSCELQQVISICGLSGVIDKMPQGIDTIIGNSGVFLSGGQRQRICIARAILAKPEILILDEATNSLDKEAEQNILAKLKEYMHGRTIIFISHTLQPQDLGARAIFFNKA